MKQLSQILSAITPRAFTATADCDIRALQYDSRKVEAGDCFFAIRGTQSDGHDYIDKAIEQGAAAIVCEKMPEKLGGSIMIISHQERILNIADRVIVVANGEVRTEGSRDEILPDLLASSSPCSVLTDKL